MTLVIYYCTVLVCFIFSLVVFKYNKGFKVLPWLMGITVVVEVITGILANIYVINPFGFYHFFLPVAACLFVYFFYSINSNTTIRKILLVALSAYIITSLCLTFFFYRLTDFPGLQINLLGFILISISVYTLLTLEPIYNIPIYKHPVAWICLGIIVFYTGTFFLNGIYNYLVVTKSGNRIIIHSIINNGLNCFMYSCFIVGLLCSHALKKLVSSESS